MSAASSEAAAHRRRRRAAAGTVVLLALALSLLPLVGPGGELAGDPATASSATGGSGERITDYQVLLEVRTDGDLHVRETIVYDFTATARDKHGIYRMMSLRSSWDEDFNREWRISGLSVLQDGAAANVRTKKESGTFAIRIGDDDHPVSGVHTYQLDYVIRGAFVTKPDQIELAWNAIGTYWPVQVEKATVQVDPGAVDATSLGCVYGAVGSSKQCERVGDTYTAENLQPYQGMTVGYGFPLGSIDHAQPILAHKITWWWVFLGRPWAVLVGIALALSGLGIAFVRWFRGGRDETFAGQVPGLTPAEGQDAEVVVGRRDVETSVQFSPPQDALPAELEVLVTERATNAGTTATLLHLATRGALTVRQLDRGRDGDWELVFPPSTDVEMNPWESTLYRSIRRKRDDEGRVVLGDARYEFATAAAAHRAAALDAVVDKGWFRTPPGKQAMRMTTWGKTVLFASVAAGFASVPLAVTSIAAGGAVAGVALWLFGRQMPARSAKGSAVLAESRAFERFIDTAELEQIRHDERLAIFHRYLPYAVVFGLTDKWVRTFQPVLAEAARTGSVSALPVVWLAASSASFDNAFAGFTAGMEGSLGVHSASASGGSGFASVGGGGGGGGGGSW